MGVNGLVLPFFKKVRLFLVQLAEITLPILVVLGAGAALVQMQSLSLEYRAYALIALAVVAIIGSLYFLHSRVYVAYGMALGGFSLLYAASYYAYNVDLLSAERFFQLIALVSAGAIISAIRFEGWLLAVLAISMAGALPTVLLQDYFNREFLLIYLMVMLAVILLLAYGMYWFELVPLGFVWYLLYNPLLFQTTTLEPQGVLLTVNQALYAMGFLFAWYTILPWLHSLATNKQHVFDSLCITFAGAYTFALSRFVINSHLVKVKELPFFIKMLVRDVPTMTNIHVQMFFIYMVVYAVLFGVLFIVNRKSLVVLATLANLCCLSFFGLAYVHSNTFAFIASLMQWHKFVFDLIS